MSDTTNRRTAVSYTVHDDPEAGTVTVAWDGGAAILHREGARASGLVSDLDAIRAGWR